MGAEGVRLVGRLVAADGTQARFAPDLAANLAYADTWFGERVKGLCDRFTTAAGIDLPEDEVEQFAYEPPTIEALDLRAEGISTVLWTSGYRPAFQWVELPVIDELGLPIQRDGATSVPGLTFLGTPWLVDMTSGNLLGLTRDAEQLAARW
jgi:putative flavoprotein involved in K+ transport